MGNEQDNYGNCCSMNLTDYLANSSFVMKCFVLRFTVLFRNTLLDSGFLYPVPQIL